MRREKDCPQYRVSGSLTGGEGLNTFFFFPPTAKGIPHGLPHGLHLAAMRASREKHASTHASAKTPFSRYLSDVSFRSEIKMFNEEPTKLASREHFVHVQ